jgi:hypothetical protein
LLKAQLLHGVNDHCYAIIHLPAEPDFVKWCGFASPYEEDSDVRVVALIG